MYQFERWKRYKKFPGSFTSRLFSARSVLLNTGADAEVIRDFVPCLDAIVLRTMEKTQYTSGEDRIRRQLEKGKKFRLWQ